MKKIYPEKLKKGDLICVVAPSASLSIISDEIVKIAKEKLESLGFEVMFSKNSSEMRDFMSSSISSRVTDLHEALKNPKVKAIITAIGGYNSNQLLAEIDWEVVRNNPKIFCGFSDITVLNNAIFAKTGLVNYSGPSFFNFGQKKIFDYTVDHFIDCLCENNPIDIIPSPVWSNDKWRKDQETVNLLKTDGFWILNQGEAEGNILGGNLCTFNLLQGTEYFPDIKDSILLLEEDDETGENTAINFDRDLQSVINQKNFDQVRGLVIGRFEKSSEMTEEILKKIVSSKRELSKIPVIANADFGHSDPKFTFPIGGVAKLKVSKNSVDLKIIKH